MKKYITLIIILILAVGVMYFQQSKIEKLSNEIFIYAENQSTLLNDVVKYKTKDSLNVASVSRLTLEKKELETHREDLLSKISDLNLKLKRVKSITNTQIATEANVKTIIRDTVLIQDAVSCFQYNDKHIDVSGCILEDTIDLNIHSVTDLTQVVHRVPKKFLCFKFGVKAIRQEIMTDNSYTDINFSEYIELK